MCPSVFRGSLRIAGFNFSFVIKMCWWPEKALASSISHTGLLYLSKISHNCTVHTTSCSALQTLIKVLSLICCLSQSPSSSLCATQVIFDLSSWSADRVHLASCPHPLAEGHSVSLSAAVLVHMQGSVFASSSSHAQQCALMLRGGKIIAGGDLIAWSHSSLRYI